MKKLFLLFFSVFLVLACDKRDPKEHWVIYFTNNSDDTVMVFNYYWSTYSDNTYEDPKKSDHRLRGPRNRYQVAPQMTRTDLFILREASPFIKKETFERLFERIECYYIYVLPNDYDGVSYHSDARIVCYGLTLDDLINLDFHLYYPPDEKMRGIYMDPPYETFISDN